jgi:hypothetical protein
MAKFGYIFRGAFLALNFSRQKSVADFLTRRQEKVPGRRELEEI